MKRQDSNCEYFSGGAIIHTVWDSRNNSSYHESAINSSHDPVKLHASTSRTYHNTKPRAFEWNEKAYELMAKKGESTPYIGFEHKFGLEDI